ncbi:Eukaryotic translation initiation factor 4G-like protein [Daphnia magna]|uniref:Eukaryotic translation initiation factor 4G-like protein n=1 Tax=Daphnia magna TaxID=35525 RepID=A0A164V756_9CRUS|nr:Eukaryotic translation initiation factor 4G-like protein [Daphnia magna]
MQEEIVQLRKSNKELTGKLAKIEANSSPAGQIHQEQIKEPETTRRVYDRRALMELKDSVGTTNIKSLLYFGILRDSHSEKSTPTNQGVEFMTRSYHPLFPAMEHGQPRKREIRLMSSQEEPRKANNPNVWIPKRLFAKSEDGNKTSSEEILRTIRGILNKLTPSNYQRLLAKIQETNIDSQDCLAGVIRIFFAKVVEESIFASIYAKMCLALSTKDVASSSDPAETINFRKLILSHCQREFEKDSAGLVKTEQKRLEFENAETETEKHKLQEELKELVDKNRRTSHGNIIFIGELFKVNVISSNVMHQCIRKLLSHKEDEDSIECLCKLLTTVGKQLESSTLPDNGVRPNFTNAQIMTSYIQTLQTIAGERKVSSRIRFMIQDVVDLRKTGWKPRRVEIGPRTIEEIHKEMNQELEGQQKQLPDPQKQWQILKESRPVKQVKDTINNRTPKVPTSQARIPVNTRAQTENPNSVSTPNFKIVTAQIKMETFPDKVMLLKVSQGNYPHIVGKGGKNIDRVNLKFGVRIQTKVGESARRDYNFTISGNDAENRKAAAKDLLDGLPVCLECPDITLDGVNNLKIKQMNKDLRLK